MTQGIWFFGPTGTGKSHEAFRDYSPETHYLWKNDNGWQDGYVGQPVVIINDFRGKNLNYEELLTLVDKWPTSVSRRGREPVPFTSTTVIITSSLRPEDIYNRRAKEDSLKQFHERFITVATTGQSLRKKPKPNPFVDKLLKSTLGVIIHPRDDEDSNSTGDFVPPGSRINPLDKGCDIDSDDDIVKSVSCETDLINSPRATVNVKDGDVVYEPEEKEAVASSGSSSVPHRCRGLVIADGIKDFQPGYKRRSSYG